MNREREMSNSQLREIAGADWRHEWNHPSRYDEGPIRVASGPMTVQEFLGRVEYLFGPEWRSELSARFRKDKKTIYRWNIGRTKIPGPVAAAVRAMWQCKRYGLEY
jgi:hypothetical protein